MGWRYSILAAENFYNLLTSFNLNIFLSLFHKIFEKTDDLCNIIKKSQNDVDCCTKKIEEFQLWLHDKFFQQFNNIYEDALSNNSAPRLRHNVTCAHKEYKRLYVQVIDTISAEIDDRYSEIFKLQFFKLLDCKLFDKYNISFPTAALQSLLNIYLNHFDSEALKSQLMSLYSSPELRECNIFSIIDFIHENCLVSRSIKVSSFDWDHSCVNLFRGMCFFIY